ncbi:ABC transporter ATP-binding protein [Alkalilimnicola ehrlichii MLHE-1]|uniref:ABC transporter related protein n=1 Tax=Alkalilimnicola ehrlichii (strain ATCC BAA-1101 / DSM 17681 / MLHE-1) TaxID=187272 RepID=Q0A5A2_ALKEH|nr:ABC transporter ATP-binding protein [Alkalilimnicola ehrlichii]ABI57985.1 ABC transporter related protein [Alkalilimnicola ehrlichii MLHE-1]
MPDSPPTTARQPAGPASEDTAPGALLQAEHLSRHYASHTALSGFSLTLHRGEVVGLLGPNGAGKSTALKLLAGVLPPSSGRARLAGHDLIDAGQRYRRQLGYLPERPPLYPDMRVHDYLRFCARLRGADGGRTAVGRALTECGLEAMADRRLDQLSQGYRQRVGIAQAVVHRPPLIILDEPTVGLDPRQLQGIRQLIRRLARAHGILLSSHLLPEIQALADRVIILQRGRICHQGPARGEPHARRFNARFRRDPHAGALEGLPGVAAARAVAPEHWQLRLTPDADPDRVISAVAAAGWGLEAWQPAGDSLEQVFLRATQGPGGEA